MPTSRQATRRSATRQEILDTARAQMAAQGAAALSLRAIARQMGLSAPALYRYFADRDAVVTALIVDAFNALADTLSGAGADSSAGTGARLWAIGLAYRQWALAHPQDYLLIFGTPIPGYHAPAEITAPVAKRSFDVLAEALQRARGALPARLNRLFERAPAGVQAQVAAWRSRYGYEIASPALLLALVAWTRMHGLVSLELVGQLEPFFGDPAELYQMEMTNLLEVAGLRLA